VTIEQGRVTVTCAMGCVWRTLPKSAKKQAAESRNDGNTKEQSCMAAMLATRSQYSMPFLAAPPVSKVCLMLRISVTVSAA
jgi:hypothetical protein